MGCSNFKGRFIKFCSDFLSKKNDSFKITAQSTEEALSKTGARSAVEYGKEKENERVLRELKVKGHPSEFIRRICEQVSKIVGSEQAVER